MLLGSCPRHRLLVKDTAEPETCLFCSEHGRLKKIVAFRKIGIVIYTYLKIL